MTDPTPAAAPDGAPTDPPAEPDWKAEARKWEQRAKDNQKTARENADAAKRLAELEDANKSELQKVAERAEAAERRAAELEQAQQRTALLTDVASTSEVPAELLSGPSDLTREALDDYATRLKVWAQNRRGPVVINPGGTPTTTVNEEAAFARSLFGGTT